MKPVSLHATACLVAVSAGLAHVQTIPAERGSALLNIGGVAWVEDDILLAVHDVLRDTVT